MELSEIIKNYRKENQKTLEDIAKIANLSKPYISMLEKNKNTGNKGKRIQPSYQTLTKLAKAMNITVEKLISKMNDTESEEPNESAIPKGQNLDIADILQQIINNLNNGNIQICNGQPMNDLTKTLISKELSHVLELIKLMK